MNKSKIFPALQILAVVLAALLSLNALAEPRTVSTGRVLPQLSELYTWYDGDREQKVWLNPQVVAEFNPSAQSADVARSVDANATTMILKRRQGAVRLWQMNNTGGTAVRSMAAGNPSGRYSPVFHDSSSSAGAMRALPGNIIVYLDPALNAATVKNWLKSHNLEVVKKLEIGPNIYVIKTAPGLESLNTANALYQSGEVKAAFPDWWREVSTR